MEADATTLPLKSNRTCAQRYLRVWGEGNLGKRLVCEFVSRSICQVAGFTC